MHQADHRHFEGSRIQSRRQDLALLFEDLKFQVKKLHKSYGLHTNVAFQNFWYNAYYKGQGQEWHDHLPQYGLAPIWSGVYFAKNCFPGQFAFQKPDMFSMTST